jgi:flagellar hook-length control protein FliK
MQSPLTALMGLADGAVGLMQRVLKPVGGKNCFDKQLSTALTERPESGKRLSVKSRSSRTLMEDETRKEGQDSPQALALLPNLSSQTPPGVSNQDGKALLLGKGSDVSDEGLKAILASCGIEEGDLGKIMADQKLVEALKAKLAEMVSSDAAAAQFLANKGSIIGLENRQAATLEITAEIKNAIMARLKSEGISGTNIIQDPSEVQASEDVQPAIAQSVDVLENTFGISKKSLRDLFFSQDTLARQAALDDAASKINTFLKANADKQLTKQCADALSMLRSALSKEEQAPVEKAISLWRPDLAGTGTSLAVSKETFGALTRTLGEDHQAFIDRSTQRVMEQIRLAAPLQMKDGEGSFTLQLRPPMLGRVDVSIHLEDGAIQATFKTDQAFTRDILQQNMHMLKEAFAEQGIKVTQVSVSTDLPSMRNPSGSFAWTDFQRGQHGSSGNGGDRDTNGTYRAHDEGEYTPVNGYSESGGIDTFA